MTQREPEDAFMTVAEVAAALRLNQQTVRNWIDDGKLPAVRVGRRVRIKRSDYDQIVAENYSGGPAPARASEPAPPASSQPSADDFWGGESVGAVELARGQRAAG